MALDSRPFRSCQTPPEIKQRILALSSHFPRREFVRRIGINPSTLSLWQSEQNHAFVDNESEPFMLMHEVSECLEHTPVHLPTSQLTVTNAGGISLSWTGEISPEQLAVLVEVLK